MNIINSNAHTYYSTTPVVLDTCKCTIYSVQQFCIPFIYNVHEYSLALCDI